ncbi:transcriptional regulator [Calderihabitans maritimus]|uniref:Transcriptional regulator, partial n=2 Tax=Calderihabitans maritimus TaxID=1246530 RepID=A0A1Z5HSX7_9FIRM|nr:transcriptional regulator [Calderihabitans maritimus]
MKAMWKAGLNIPEDIAVMGFDDIQFAILVYPDLSKVRTRKDEMGSLAMRHCKR